MPTPTAPPPRCKECFLPLRLDAAGVWRDWEHREQCPGTGGAPHEAGLRPAVRHPTGRPVTEVRWVLSPVDFRAHVLPETADSSLGVWIARCGHGMPSAAGVDEVPRGAPCRACALAALPVGPHGFDW